MTAAAARLATAWLLLAAGAACALAEQPALPRPDRPATVTAAQARDFAEKIEPLFKSRCFSCHSHAAGEMAGGLTLDSRGGWIAGGDRGRAIVPGKPDESLLLRAVRRQDPDLRMPPDEALSEQEIARLAEWIRSGAADPRTSEPASKEEGDPTDWWSLRPLKRPVVPPIAGPGLAEPGSEEPGLSESAADPINPIDAFVRRGLRSWGLSPAPRADRRTLIRRLYFDLHGLPPTPEEVDAFEADPDPRAYEKLVDRLLNSPRYGERWARHWLDTVHFADSHGCEHDVFRPHAWRYRDYVIASLNRDIPWPRFVREQLAADWFYPQETQLTAALGFVAAGPLELSRAGTAPVTFDYLDRDDIVTQTMAAFASTTANCARCHDHKFDPITQEDYYALQAVFAGAGKGDREFDEDPAVATARRRWATLLAAARDRDAATLLAPRGAELVKQWERQRGDHPATWQPLSPRTFTSSDGSSLSLLEDGSLLATGTRPDKDTYTITSPLSLRKLSALRLDVLAHDSLPMQGPGRCDNGNLHLNEFEALVVNHEAAEPRRLKFRRATADWDQSGWTIAHALDGDERTAWGIFPKVGQSHHAVFELEQPVELGEASRLVVRLRQLHGGGHLIGRLKLHATDTVDADALLMPDPVRAALREPPAERSPQQRLEIAAHALRLRAERELAALPAPAKVYAWSRHYSHAKRLDAPQPPKTVHILQRGAIDRPGPVARPGALAVVDELPGRFELDEPDEEASRRAALADWLAAEDNPLTWRSIVNRVWSYHFGRGICDTPNDFGRMGGKPSHPELLDWLAVWFRDDARGSLKELHRLILLSETWRQSSNLSDRHVPTSDHVDRPSDDALAVDRENRLLWRMNRRRLDAESFRDAVRQVSGRIDLTMGGPGIQQFTQSPGQQATPKLDYEAFDWNHPSAARRSIYRVVWRGIADPFMESLDFPDLGLLAPKRGFSVSGLQALTLFNDAFVLHHSRVLAQRVEADRATLDEQVNRACRLILLREPRDEQHTLLVAYAQRHGLAATCRILLNSNDFLFLD